MATIRFSLFVLIVIIILSLSACEDPFNSVGIDTIPQSDLSPARIDTIYASNHFSKRDQILTISLDRTFLGAFSAPNQWDYEAWTCLKFYHWPDTLLGVVIDTAKIYIKIANGLGNQTLPLSFSVYKALRSWSGDSLSYDSLKYPSVYYNSSALLTQINEDTGWISISITDTAIIRRWLSSNVDTTHLNDGLILRPTGSNVIKGLYSFNASDANVQPRLSITYHRNDSTQDYNTYTHSYGTAKYVSNISLPPSIQLATDSLIYIQNGNSFHGYIAFDSLKLSPQILLYGAYLELTLLPSSSSISYRDSLIAFQTTSNGLIDYYNYMDVGIPSTQSSGKRVYKFNVRNLLVQWIKNSQRKMFAIGGHSEGLSFDLFTLYGSKLSTPIELRPRLILTYYTKQ